MNRPGKSILYRSIAILLCISILQQGSAYLSWMQTTMEATSEEQIFSDDFFSEWVRIQQVEDNDGEQGQGSPMSNDSPEQQEPSSEKDTKETESEESTYPAAHYSLNLLSSYAALIRRSDSRLPASILTVSTPPPEIG